MLRFGVLVLLVALPYINGTPDACERRFHKLYARVDHKKSNCEEIKVLTGFRYTLSHCEELTCKAGGNAINFKETRDDFEDNECHILSCKGGNLKLTESNEGFNVYLNDAEESMQCTASNNRLLSCWTCRDASDEATCLRKGSFDPCLDDNSICGQYVETDTKGRTWKVSRGCMPANQCTDSMWGKIGECQRVNYNDKDLVFGCQHCGYDLQGTHHRCYQVRPHLRNARLYGSQQGWTMVSQVHDGKDVECPLLAQEETNYSTKNCERLALAVGGNVISHRNSAHCRVHKCDVTGAGISDLQLRDIDHGWNIFVLAHELPCSSLGDHTLSCFTCDEDNESKCWRKGQMQDCAEKEDVCLHRRSIDANEKLTHVTRGCTRQTECTEAMWDPNSYAACTLSKSGAQTCDTCLFGAPGKIHGCHAPFDQKCIKKFDHVQEDDTGREMTPSCVQVANQRDHWLHSCFNLACMTGANVVHFGGTRCEVYICQLEKNEQYIFRNRRGHRLRIYTAQ